MTIIVLTAYPIIFHAIESIVIEAMNEIDGLVGSVEHRFPEYLSHPS